MSHLGGVVGRWEIMGCVPETAIEGKRGITGTTFDLSNLGEVRWTVPDETVNIPLLHCDTYEVVSRGQFLSNALLRFGTYRGHILEFHVDTYKADAGLLVMSQGWCLIQCKRVGDCIDEPTKPPFSLLPALEDGYFADLEIKSENNRIFKAHTCILKMSAPDLDWLSTPPPLSGLPEDVLGTMLHYLYAQCLPTGLHARTAERVVIHLSDIPALHNLQNLCTSYLNHLTFKTQILDIVGEIQACASRMIEGFAARNIRYDPAKLCLAIKQAFRDAAVANAKLLLLSELYNKRKAELTPVAVQEVIRYIQSKGGPAVLGQLKSFLLGVSSALSGLQVPQRQDLACYLIPEIESILDTAVSILVKITFIIDVMLKQGLKEEEEADQSENQVTNLEETLNNVLHKKELIRFRCLLQRISCFRKQLLQRKENFRMLSSGNRVRSLTRNLEQVIEELPVFLLRLEEVTGTLDHKFEWNVSQFCFKVGTAKVCEVLRKLVREKDNIQDLIVHLCQLVERDSFSQSMVTLGLLDADAVPIIHPADQKTEQSTPTHSGQMLNLTESFSVSPTAEQSELSTAAGKLLQYEVNTDMVFEVVEAGCITRLPAHRVIVAARCDWFRRALLSGMQEDIQRRIEVHDGSAFLFSKFLEYLYTGRLASDTLSGDQLVELLLLGDRYEVDALKEACEEALRPHIEEESVLDLFTLADQFNALGLKHSCMHFISNHPTVLDHDMFTELPCNLQVEVYDWVKPPEIGRRNVPSPTIVNLTDRTASLHLGNCMSSPEELEIAVNRLRDIVGEDVSRSRLENILLATNLDLSRALDLFYFTTS